MLIRRSEGAVRQWLNNSSLPPRTSSRRRRPTRAGCLSDPTPLIAHLPAAVFARLCKIAVVMYYIAKRILLFIPTSWASPHYLHLMQAPPGDPVQGMVGERASAETIDGSAELARQAFAAPARGYQALPRRAGPIIRIEDIDDLSEIS